MVSCKKENGFHSFFKNPDMNQSFTTGTWHLAYRAQKGEDISYAGYDFTFKSNNILLIHHGKETFWGKWSVYTTDATDDAPAADTEFIMIFPPDAPHVITVLNHSYTILKRNRTMLELVNFDTPQREKITFIKS